MQRRKSARHVNAANARWRAVRAQDERDNGIPDEPIIEDRRQPFDLPLAGAGFVDLRIEPRLGYVSWRAVDAATGQVLHCAAMCHRDNFSGIHGQRRAWSVRKMTELSALNETLRVML